MIQALLDVSTNQRTNIHLTVYVITNTKFATGYKVAVAPLHNATLGSGPDQNPPLPQ